MSGPHRTTYAHCQFYGYCVIYQALGHEMTGSWETCKTSNVVDRNDQVLPYEVFYYQSNGKPEDTKAEEPEDTKAEEPEETKAEIEAVKEVESYESLYSFLESHTSWD